MRKEKIRYGKAEIIENKNQLGFSGAVRLIKFNRRYYTVYGRYFAVAGRNVRYQDALRMKHYKFLDWNNFSGMFADV